MKDKYVERLLSRDEDVLAEIEKKYGRLWLNLAQNVTGDLRDAEECLNDTLLEIWESIPPNTPESMLSFGAMVVRRRAIDRLRQKTAEKRGGREYFIAYDELADVSEGFSVYLEGEITDAINDFLVTLSSTDRRIFVGRYFMFDSNAGIAKKLSLSENSVKIRLTKMRKKLRAFLEKRGIFV